MNILNFKQKYLRLKINFDQINYELSFKNPFELPFEFSARNLPICIKASQDIEEFHFLIWVMITEFGILKI